MVINYGLNKVRFPTPLKEGQRYRLNVKLGDVAEIPNGVEGLLKAGGVTTVRGAACLAGKGVVDVSGDRLQAKNIIIAIDFTSVLLYFYPTFQIPIRSTSPTLTSSLRRS